MSTNFGIMEYCSLETYQANGKNGRGKCPDQIVCEGNPAAVVKRQTVKYINYIYIYKKTKMLSGLHGYMKTSSPRI